MRDIKPQVQRIVDTWGLVNQAENRKIRWSKIIVEVGDVDLREIKDPIDFFVELYRHFRILEAAAYHFREKWTNDRAFIGMQIIWARKQREAIEAMIRVVENHEESITEFGVYGQFALLKDLHWALELIDEKFPAWGY